MAMEKTVIERALQAYGVPIPAVSRAQKGYRNSSYPIATNGRVLNLILYKEEPGIVGRIKRANAVADFVANTGLPARKTYDERILRLTAGDKRRYLSLYDYLPGDTIPWEGYTMEHLKVLGKTMAMMHHALSDYHEESSLPAVEVESLQQARRMQRYFCDPGVVDALQSKLKLATTSFQFEDVFAALQKSSRRQALHMDFVRGNILYMGTSISGILDFEKTACGDPVFDVARTLAFLLVDCKYKSDQKIRKYFLQSGYIKRGDGHIQETPPALFERLVQFYLLHDFYKFLRHNPYEGLPFNEHFVRTKDHLLKVGLIRQV
jgi:Ser/Thr protein kinase RdoA (MazF antagonist)